MSSLSTSSAYGRSRLLFITVISVASFLTGCGENNKSSTQVAAQVGADEITIGQVNNVFAKMQAIPGKNATQIKHDVLDSLIDQQLTMQQAIDQKLDRDPAVMQAIEESKRAILSRAYIDKIRAAVPAPSAAEISKYYADHPDIFAQRRIYNLRELDIAVKPGLADVLRAQIAKGVALEAIAADLKSKSIPFNASSSTHAPEETAFDILSKISVLKDGQMTLIETKNALSILQVVTSKPAPVDEKTVTASIQQYLNNTRSKEEIIKQLKSLRNATKIEYFGEFLASADTKADASKLSAETSSKMTEQPNSPDSSKVAAQSPSPDVSKVMSGLK
jgi:EpsD family peptidyl-prolyl cis-trans isomerase